MSLEKIDLECSKTSLNKTGLKKEIPLSNDGLAQGGMMISFTEGVEQILAACNSSSDSQVIKAKSPVHSSSLSQEASLTDILVKYGNNPDGIPALLYAAKKGDLSAVQLLIQHGADPFTRAINNNSALYFALYSHNPVLVEFFLNQGLKPNDAFTEGRFYNEALEVVDVESFRLLIDYGLELASDAYYYHWDMPSIACLYAGRLDLFKLVLEKGGDLPRDKVNGIDPLLWAVVQCNQTNRGKAKLECLEWLIQNKKLDSKDLDCSNGHLITNTSPKMLEFFIDNGFLKVNQKLTGSEDYPINGCYHRPDLLKMLIKKGANVNARGQGGNTVLHNLASGDGVHPETFEMIKILILNGADINARNDAGKTPIMRDNIDPKIKRFLLSYGAKERP